MPARLRPPADADADAMLAVILAPPAPDAPPRTFAELEGHEFQPLEDDEELAGVALGERWEQDDESAGMRPTWQAERWEKALGRA
jgi:hypothetical protein